MHLSQLAVRRPIATTMLLLAAVLLGAVSLPRLEMTLLPEVRPAALTVWIPYADAGVDEIEESVARPIEEVLVTVRGVRGTHTEIVPGGASITCRLYPGADADLVTLGMRERLDTVRWDLPEGVERPVILGASDLDRPAIVLALAAEDLPHAAEWAEDVLRPRLEQIDGVARAAVVGAPEREIRVIPDPDRLETLDLSVRDLVTAIGEANVDTPGGYLRRREIRFAVDVESSLRNAVDVADVVVARKGDRIVRVADVARVVDDFEDPRGWSRLDGRPAVGILLTREAGANLVRMADAVHERLAEVATEFPDFDVAVVADASPFVRQSLAGVWQAVWMGSLLAYLVLLAFLRDGRSPLFLILALPISVVTTFSVLDVLGVSLNLMSLGGIALGVGMLVDNAIICLENIHRLRASGVPSLRAAGDGAREVALPILASTLTTCAVFAPLAFVPGAVGELFRDQAIAVGVSLGVSLVVALTLLPMLAGRFSAGTSRAARLPLYDRYHRVLAYALDRPRRTLAVTAAILAYSVLVVASLPRETFPAVATENLEVRLRLPSGTDVAATDAAVAQVEEWLSDQPAVERVFTSVGAADTFDPSERDRQANRGTLRARLRGDAVSGRDALVEAMLVRFAGTPGWQLDVANDRPELAALVPAGDATLTCRVSGPDHATAESLAATIAGHAESRMHDRGHPLRLAAAESEPRFRLRLDQDVARRRAISESEAFAAIQAAASGVEATRIRRFDEENPVVVRQADGTAFEQQTIVTGGRAYAMRDLFDVATELAPARLIREDQARVATIRWDGPLRDVSTVVHALEAGIDEAALPPGYVAEFGGAHTDMRETLGGITRAFLLSAGLVLLILAAQFESVRLPLVIFAAVPLAAVGVSLSLAITGNTLNVISGMGLVILIGIVVNDAILKVDLMRRLVGEGRSVREAVLIASRRRYRPILMTTATTALALAPMLVGRGAELRAPLAITVIGGLTSATLLTLIVVPVLFEGITGRRFAGREPR